MEVSPLGYARQSRASFSSQGGGVGVDHISKLVNTRTPGRTVLGLAPTRGNELAPFKKGMHSSAAAHSQAEYILSKVPGTQKTLTQHPSPQLADLKNP